MKKEKHDTENLSIISSKGKFGLDYLWEKLPHISAYQLRITGMASYASVLGGFLAIYPVFAQYTPPHRCQTFFDNNEDFSWLTWKQVEQLTLETPFCGSVS
jgi:OCT family organic cation transporter-like MFS transporter 4/5